MRKFLLIVLTTLAGMSAHAWEPSTDDANPEATFAQPSNTEAMVTIAPVPMPGAVIELASYSPQRAGLRQSKKVKAAKVARAKSMMSRSAREQMALANIVKKTSDRELLDVSDDEDDDFGVSDQDLHRSFSQPKVARLPDQTEDEEDTANDLPDHIKLRLLLARSKAVEAHILNQAGKASDAADDTLSETVKLRLFMARARAVQVHTEKFGAS